MAKSVFLGLVLFCCSFSSVAQQAVVVQIQELPRIQQSYGPDSLWALVGAIPIWMVNEQVAFTLLRSIPSNYERYSRYRSYAKELGTAVSSVEIAGNLWKLFEHDVANSEHLDYDHASVQSLDEDLLLALLYQNAPETEQRLASVLQRYTAVRTLVEARPKPSFFRRFFNGLGTAGWSLENVEHNLYLLLTALHRLNPVGYPATQVAAQRQRLHSMYADKTLRPTPVKSGCHTEQTVVFEPVQVDSVTVPRQCILGCRTIKLMQSQQVYFVCSWCPSPHGGFGGFGNTYLVQHQGLNVELCYVSGWRS